MRKLFAHLMAVLFVSCGFALGQGLNDGLVAYYPFNGNANDESGNGNDGVLRGATLTDGRNSEPESALHFNGRDNYVALGYPDTLRLTEDFTISAWAYYSGGGDNRRILSFGQDGGYELMVETNDKPNFAYAGKNHRVDTTVPLNTWFHLTATKSNNIIRLYLNGVLVLEEPNNRTPSFGKEFRFGEKSQHGDGWWTGKIDDTRFYDRALTNKQIAYLYALESGNFRVQIAEGDFTWQEAKADAEAKGGRLAVLDTQEKIDVANGYLEELGEWPVLWIGATDEVNEKEWLWITDEPVTIAPWAVGENGDGDGEDYAAIWHNNPSQSAALSWGDWSNEGGSSQGGTTGSYLLETLTLPPSPPVVELDSFYESNPQEEIVVDATPSEGFPQEFTYQWSFNDQPIPSFLGGALPTFNLLGDQSQDGTWKVVVSNTVGTTEASFEYRMFVDNDSDGLSNYREENFTLTNPDLADSDADGLSDPDELSIHGTDPNIADVDEDGLNDSEEIAATTDPGVADTDNDGLLDGAEVKTYASNPKSGDTDNDGIADAAEVAAGLDINTAESIADAVAFLTQELANRPPVDGFEEAIAAARTTGREDVTSNPSLYNLYDQTAYNAVIAERDARLTLEEVKDGRLGSVLLLPDAQTNMVRLRFCIEESDELGQWITREEEAEVEIPLDPNKKFFRFSVKEDE